MPEEKPASSTTFAVTVAVSVLIGLYITILVAPAEEYTWILYMTILATTGLSGLVSFVILIREGFTDIRAGIFAASIANVAITIPGLCGLWVETLAYKHTPSIPEFGTLTLQSGIDADSTSLELSKSVALPCDFHSCGKITLQIGKDDETETVSGNYDEQNVGDLVRGSNPIEHEEGTPVKVMFMTGTLTGDLSEEDDSLTLQDAYGFPHCGTVTVGIGDEVMTGTIDGKTIRDITRAVEGTAAEHKSGDEVRLLHRVKDNNIVYGTAATGVGLHIIMVMFWLYERGLTSLLYERVLLSGSPPPPQNPFRTNVTATPNPNPRRA